MPQHLGVKGVKKALDSRKFQKPSTVNSIDCLKLCVNENHFEFNRNFYTRIHGTFKGPKMAPGYASLSMGIVEEELWQKCSHKPSVWSRYIDDILGLWPHGTDALKIFLEILNNLYPNKLEFTSCFNYHSAPFLDLRIYRDPEGFLKTDLFVKSTFKNLYLKYDSYNTKHILDINAVRFSVYGRSVPQTNLLKEALLI
ncbi:hypothetical protein HOLleu_42712 [Holothuria leucospilota]|uniref:Reverse transcriptase domain-containing protein n=1 Tax=Holothuria leucospilota TaxID=206669 RepID=A0A9Q1BA02_HOLLE|nr:hypothetical protein HOLleu_42712 [Holothuria leucospilota]